MVDGVVIVLKMEQMCVGVIVVVFLVDLYGVDWFVFGVIGWFSDVGDGYCCFGVEMCQCVGYYFQYGFFVYCVGVFECVGIDFQQCFFCFIVVGDYVGIELG